MWVNSISSVEWLLCKHLLENMFLQTRPVNRTSFVPTKSWAKQTAYGPCTTLDRDHSIRNWVIRRPLGQHKKAPSKCPVFRWSELRFCGLRAPFLFGSWLEVLFRVICCSLCTCYREKAPDFSCQKKLLFFLWLQLNESTDQNRQGFPIQERCFEPFSKHHT